MQSNRQQTYAPCIAALALLVLVVLGAGARSADAWTDPTEQPDTPQVTVFEGNERIMVMRTWYVAWNGRHRALLIVYPREPRGPLPLIVAFHPATGDAACDGGFVDHVDEMNFAVACIGGQGVGTRGSSYGAPGEIADAFSVPDMVRHRAEELPIDFAQVLLAGSSMGGLEALLTANVDPERFTTVVALDAPVDLSRRYLTLRGHTAKDENKRQAMLAECGGPPARQPDCYRSRSPLFNMGRIASSKLPVIVEWSARDVIGGDSRQSPRYVRRLGELSPGHCIDTRVSRLQHGASWSVDLPVWLTIALRTSAAFSTARAAGLPFGLRGGTCS